MKILKQSNHNPAMECKTVALTLGDLMREQKQYIGQYIVIDAFQKLLNGVKSNEDQTKVLSKERENWKPNLNKETVYLTFGREELKSEKEGLSKNLIERKSIYDLMRERKLGYQYFYASQKLLNGKKSNEDQTKVLSKERENWKPNLNKETVHLTLGKEEQKKRKEKKKSEKEGLSKNHIKSKSRLDSLENAVQDIKTNQEKEIKEFIESHAKNNINQDREMKEFNESHAKNIEKLKGEFEQQIQETDHYFRKKIKGINEENKRLNQDITTPKEENVMKNELKEFEDKSYCQSYILQVCLNLLANMFHIVLPDHFAEDWLYKVKDIEEAIDDEDLLKDADERQEALKRWKGLKEKLGWEPSIERTLKMLQREGNPMDCAGDLTVKFCP